MALKDMVSQTIKPGDDFYRYVNDGWLTSHPIPDQKSHVGAASILADENLDRLKALLKAPGRKGETLGVKQVKAFYRTAMDTATIRRSGLGSLKAVLERIQALESNEEVKNFITDWHSQGHELVWHFHLDVDDKDSSRYIMRFSQGGLGLPDRDYYFEDDEALEAVRKKYVLFLSKLLTLLGVEGAKEKAKRVFVLETLLAGKSDTALERRDVVANYNAYTPKQLSQEYTNFDWSSYFKKVGVAEPKKLLVSQPKFMQAAVELLSSETLETWRYYCMIHCMLPYLHALPKVYDTLNFNFYGTVLSGVKKQETRYRRIIQMCMHMLPEPTGQLFVETYFDEPAKAAIYELVDHITGALKLRIEKLPWMSDDTKKLAIKKLDTFLPLLGYPDTWRNYSALKLPESYVDSLVAIRAFEWRYDITRLHSPVDRQEWLMSPALVNAYYWPNTNGITFPAAILQPPFFDATGDFAANYGAIGAVIGHEITHGFDDKGALYDRFGKLNSWWSDADWTAFAERTKQLEKQYDNYEIDGHQVNGELTLGENIADLGGTMIAFDALLMKLKALGTRESLHGFTPEQRFFISYANIWRENMRPEFTQHLLMTNPHAPCPLRVNGVVANIDAFYEAFDVQNKDALYKSPSSRVRIW